ncbi:MAG: hypothetical protein KJO29_04615, partial [Bacteroidia bacterium]|nr:hypothetical protein [Bacteroidia bacterium]
EEYKRLSKLQMKDIINGLNLVELKSFILNYARSDKMFEWICKSHFISKMNLGDDGLKYKRLLDELIKPKNSKNQKISVSLAKTLSIIFKDFVQQMEDCLSTEDYIESFHLAYHSLIKIFYLQNRFMLKNKAIENCRIQFLYGLSTILEQDLAPVFRQKAEQKLKESILVSYYIPREFNLVTILDDHNCLTESDKSEVLESLSKKYEASEEKVSILASMLHLAYPIDSLAIDILRKYNHQNVYRCLKLMIENRMDEHVEFYLENEKLEFNYNTTILKALLFNERGQFSELAVTLNHLDIIDVPIIELRELLDKITNAFYRKEFKNIKKFADSLQFGMQSKIYAASGNYNGLINLLREENDLDWVFVFDRLLINEGYKTELRDLFYIITERFIQQHLGMKSRHFIEKLNQRLVRLSQPAIRDYIHEKLYRQFSHRKSIKSLIE